MDMLENGSGSASSFYNLISGLGGGGDHAGAKFKAREPLDHDTIAQLVRQNRLLRRAVESAPKDIIRAWRVFETSDQSFQDVEDRFDLEEQVEIALIYSNVFGGAFIIPEYDMRAVGLDELARPFRQPRPGMLRGFRVFQPCELMDGSYRNGQVGRQSNGLPLVYKLKTNQKNVVESNSYKEILIHHSWVHPFFGEKSMDSGRRYGQSCEHLLGNSMVDGIYNDLANDTAGLQALSHLLARANIDVLKTPGLMERMASCGNDADKAAAVIQQAQRRAEISIRGASNTQPMILDALEALERAGLGQGAAGAVAMSKALTDRFIASTGVPRTKIIGEQSKGLKNGGEVDLKYYYDDVAATRRRRCKKPFRWIDGLIAADIGEAMPPWTFGNLWQLTEKQVAETNKLIADTDKTYADMNIPFVQTKITENLTNRGTYSFRPDELLDIKETDGPSESE